MGKKIGYAKLGRSMPLTLDKCGNLGGDVEMVAVVQELALRHPEDTFVLLGRNTGESARQAGLPTNITNPWSDDEDGWATLLRQRLNAAGLNHGSLGVAEHLQVWKIYDELTLDSFRDLDGMVLWIGQHGTSNMPLPKVDNPSELTKPQDSFAYYAGYLLRGINTWRDEDPWNREEVNLNADPRNLHKMRDVKWPLRYPVLGQHNSSKRVKHHRYGDTTGMIDDPMWLNYAMSIDAQTWISDVFTTYARLEVNALHPSTPFGSSVIFNDDWDRPGHFGVFINETRKYVHDGKKRVNIVRDWVLPLNPVWIHGTWSDESCKLLGMDIKPLHPSEYFATFPTVRCTFTTPASGTGWATAKPWEAFAAGVVCFFHPAYDDQDNILGDADRNLHHWLRVRTPEELKIRVEYLNTTAGRSDWHWLVKAQRAHFDRAIDELTYMRMIEERIWK